MCTHENWTLSFPKVAISSSKAESQIFSHFNLCFQRINIWTCTPIQSRLLHTAVWRFGHCRKMSSFKCPELNKFVQKLCTPLYSKMLWFGSILGIPTCFPAQVCLPLDIVILASWSFKAANWQTQNWHRIERSSGYTWPVLFLHRSVCPKLKLRTGWPNSGGWLNPLWWLQQSSSFGSTKCGDFFRGKISSAQSERKMGGALGVSLEVSHMAYWMALGLIYKCKLVIASTANDISGLTIGVNNWAF
jgi:hypothetical protein